MRKYGIFTISLIAIMAVRAAYAEIASKAYVDQEIDPVATQLSTHVADTDIHVTTAEKSEWSGKQDALGYTAENSANRVTDTESYNTDINDSTKYPSMPVVNEMISQQNSAMISGLAGKIDSRKAADAQTVMVRDSGGNYVKGLGNAVSVANDGTITVNEATKATQDGSGNVITSTYATKTELGAVDDKIGTVTAGKTVVEMISDAQTAATYDDTALAARVTANEGAITTLNGNSSTAGSVDYKIAQAASGYATASQGAKADTALQSNNITAASGNNLVAYDANGLVVSGVPAGTMATENTSSYYNKTDIGTIENGKTLVEMISDAQSAASYDDTALAARVTANEGAITTLNGDASTNGSVAKQIADALTPYTLKSVTDNNGDGVVTSVTQSGDAVTSTKAKITTSHIADNAGILASQLASGVQTSLGYADAYHTASATYGDIITHNAAEFASAAADGAVMTVTTDANSTGNVVTAVSGNIDGTVTVTKGMNAIPKPDGNCTDCVLHYAGGTDTFSWEEVGR